MLDFSLKGVGAEETEGRVLFTGNGINMINDLMMHIPKTCGMKKCPPSETPFRETLESFNPHVIVVCLSNETKEGFRMYSVLAETSEYLNLPVIAVGNEDDGAFFKNSVFQKNLEIFVRPLNKEKFMEVLYKYLEKGIEASKAAKMNALELEDAAAEKEIRILTEKLENTIRLHDRKMILVVDDDVLMLNLIKAQLQDLYDITLVPSGRLALKYLSKKTADIVLLDYMMPDEDGPSILKKIRQNSPQPNIPVIFLTGVADHDMVKKGLEYRPDGYLLKPVTRYVLLEKVTEVILGLQ